MEPMTDAGCPTGFQQILVQETMTCLKLYEPLWQPCPPEYKPSASSTGERMCERTAKPLCGCPPLANYSGCKQPNDYYDPIEGMCYTWFEYSKDMRACPPDYVLVPRNDKLYCAMPYSPVETVCPPGYDVAVRPDGKKVCQPLEGEPCDPEARFQSSASQTPKPRDQPSASQTPKPRDQPSASQTPKPREPEPSASQTPKPTPRPSVTSRPRQPSASQTPRFLRPSESSTPAPSKRPCDDPTNPRCQKPESILNKIPQDAAFSPLPSQKPPAPPAVSVRPIPPPSPWARPAEVVEIPPESIPPYIPSKVSFPEADITAFEKPSKVQELQASLACTLRLPLEKIRIESISLFDTTTGVRTPINVDPSLYSLVSQAGEIGCLEFAASARRMRRMQQSPSTGQQVDVDYLIVQPPPEILMLNATEFAAVIQASPVVATMAASVGSSGVASTVTVEQYAGIQTSAAQQSAPLSSASSAFPGYGIGLLSAGGALLVLSATGAAIALKMKANRRRRHFVAAQAQAESAAPEHTVTGQNQMFMGRGPIAQQASTRTVFNPVRIVNGSAV